MLGRCGSEDATVTGNQGIFPVTAGLQFDYRVTETVPGVVTSEILIVGYIM
jgi:hypothetical protein